MPIDDVLRAAVGSGTVPGVVAVVVDRDGVTYEGAHGTASADERPMTPTTLLRVASMTKAVTAIAVLQLVEAGRITLEQPVADVLPDFGDLPVLDGVDGETARLRRPRRQATVGQLLSHTCGLAYETWNADVLAYQRMTGVPSIATGRRAAFGCPLVSDPGTRWEYGLGPDWAGLVVEAVTGRRLDEAYRETILTPLSMMDTSFVPSDQQATALADIARRDAEGGGFVWRQMSVRRDAEVLSAGQGLYSTGRDFGKLLRALLRDGELDGVRVLTADSVQRMRTDALGDLAVVPLRSTQPRAAGDLAESGAVTQGLGVMVRTEATPGGRAAGSFEWNGLFNTYFWVDPASNVPAALFLQLLPYRDPVATRLLEAFEREVYVSG